MSENLRISNKLIDAINSLNTTANNLGNLKKSLKEVLNCEIKILTNGNLLLTIKPYWIELYYYKNNTINCGLNGNNNPVCNIHENKKYINRLYFKCETFNPQRKNNRDRMDICLGNKNIDNSLYISVLIKRADIYDSNGTKININFTDSTIADTVKKYYIQYYDSNYNYKDNLDKNSNIELSNYYTLNNQDDLTYELYKPNHVKLNDIKFSRRVNIVNANEYACYDSSKYVPVEEIEKVKEIQNL